VTIVVLGGGINKEGILPRYVKTKMKILADIFKRRRDQPE